MNESFAHRPMLCAAVKCERNYGQGPCNRGEACAVQKKCLAVHGLERNRLNEIAVVVQALTYGQMMELAQAVWKMKPEDGQLTAATLPPTLHRWCMSRKPHASDCAVHNEPAMPAGPCDCGAAAP